MATTTDVKLHIAGRGHVFYADVDTPAMNIDSFIFNTPSTYGSWTWLGDSSAENLIEFEVDGGEPTTKRTWDRENVRSIRDNETIKVTLNSVNVSRDTFQLGFSGHQYSASTKSYRVGTGTGSTQKALLVVMVDGIDRAAMRLPNVDLKGAFPKFSLEEFTEFPLSGTVLGSPTEMTTTGPLAWEWFEPRAYSRA